MKRGMRSYLVFTSDAYRWILFIAVPVVIIGLNTALAWNVRRITLAETYFLADLMVLLTTELLMTAEVFLDGWTFGGIAVKGSGSLDCIKASPRGRKLVRAALRTDLLRMLAESAIVVALSRAAWTVARNLGGLWDLRGIAMILAMIACQYFFTVTVLLVARHFDSFGVSMMAVWLACWMMLPLFLLARLSSFWMLGVFTALSVAASVLSQWKIMRRVEEGFYDKQV